MSSKKKETSKKGKKTEKTIKQFSLSSTFDENSFDFNLTGGPLHTELLIASAIYKIGDKIGEPVPIKCQWFNIKENGQFLEIANVSGAFYQPCVEDVGSKIYVQATPISSLEEYTGMPVFAEVGPLVMNKEIETKVTSILAKNHCQMVCKLDSSNFPIVKNGKNFQNCLPMECQIEINQDYLMFFVDDNEKEKKNFSYEILRSPLGLSFPFIKICRMTNNIFEIHFQSDQTCRLMAQNNIERDIIAVALKMFCGQKILDHKFLNNISNSSTEHLEEECKEEPELKDNAIEALSNIIPSNLNNLNDAENKQEQNNENNIQKQEMTQISNEMSKNNEEPIYQGKNDKIPNEILPNKEEKLKFSNLSQENEVLRKEKNQLIEELALLKNEKDLLCTELFNSKHNYMEVFRESEQLKTKIEKLLTEKNFLLQDLDIYKSQVKANEETITNLESRIKALKGEYEEKLQEQTCKYQNQMAVSESERVAANEKEINQLKQEIKILNEQIQMKLSTIRELSQSNEDLENKINYLLKKTESLKYETSKNYQSFEKTNFEEQDIEKLQMQIVSNEKTIKELQKNLEDEKAKKQGESGKFDLSHLASIIGNIVLVKSSNQQMQYMQKLANNLTEVITDRELALENQKNINKELIKRLNEIEDAQKHHE